MGNEQQLGALVIIGGAEDKEGDCVVLREFIRAAGGVEAEIAVMTAATSLPGEVGDEYIRVFERLGAKRVDVVHTDRREDSDREDNLEKVKAATGIFFTGGDQSRIVEYIKGTPLDDAIHQRHREGAVIGGTSAGAAMMPDEMIIEGASVSNPSVDAVEMGPGMGFLPGIVVDQHFAQRGRLGRLLAALVLQPAVLGLGIDENTAIIVTGDEFQVVGAGTITVVDETTATHNNLEGLLKDEPIALCDVKLHILPHGYRYNLKTQTPLV
ncbi:cyanophycinase [Phormidium tenue]|uniref:Cyanophycinase n=1 Tax=Phormidium tenue NIES-30 TaxID=549789 RepID=A0A1U7J864_9CYAN|nr:cyanophycinase [Phormidium tenue]MBD2231278.1 cyanophycinase [Phormidium tenue FACHB-1052]OKH49523.1 cyanophycinase [Phormidium tenue NIES-30]